MFQVLDVDSLGLAMTIPQVPLYNELSSLKQKYIFQEKIGEEYISS